MSALSPVFKADQAAEPGRHSAAWPLLGLWWWGTHGRLVVRRLAARKDNAVVKLIVGDRATWFPITGLNPLASWLWEASRPSSDCGLALVRNCLLFNLTHLLPQLKRWLLVVKYLFTTFFAKKSIYYFKCNFFLCFFWVRNSYPEPGGRSFDLI